jgi:hypothetical protein
MRHRLAFRCVPLLQQISRPVHAGVLANLRCAYVLCVYFLLTVYLQSGHWCEYTVPSSVMFLHTFRDVIQDRSRQQLMFLFCLGLSPHGAVATTPCPKVDEDGDWIQPVTHVAPVGASARRLDRVMHRQHFPGCPNRPVAPSRASGAPCRACSSSPHTGFQHGACIACRRPQGLQAPRSPGRHPSRSRCAPCVS